MFETAADYECADQWRTGYVNTPRGGDCVTNTQGLGFWQTWHRQAGFCALSHPG